MLCRNRYGEGYRLSLGLLRDGTVAATSIARAAAAIIAEEEQGDNTVVGSAAAVAAATATGSDAVDRSAFERERDVEDRATQARHAEIAAFVCAEVCATARPIERFGFAGGVSFMLPKADVCVSHVFNMMERHKSTLGVQDWSLQQSSLEEVFVRITQEAEDNESEPTPY